MAAGQTLTVALRRLQGELVLFEKQLSLFTKLAEEYYTYASYYWALRDGLLVPTEETSGGDSLLDLELKVLAVANQLVEKAMVEMEATSQSMSKLLSECGSMKSVVSLGLHAECHSYIKDLERHAGLRNDVARQIDCCQRFSSSSLNQSIQRLRYRVHVPDITPLLIAFSSTPSR
jgi:hypothetical protein